MNTEINFIPLGGQDELENDMYVLEFGKSIFIIDSGLEFPLEKKYGIKYYIPKLDYLIKRKKDIKGIFLSSNHYSKIGSLNYLIKTIPKVPIFASFITLKSLKIFFTDYEKWNIVQLIPKKKIIVENVEITPFELASSHPGVLGFQFNYYEQYVIYMTNYIFDSIPMYKINVQNIFPQSKVRKLLFITDSINAAKNNNSDGFSITNNIYQKIKETRSKVYVAIYNESIYNILEVIKIANDLQRSVYVNDEKIYKLILMYQEEKIIPKSKINLLSNTNKISKEGIIIFTANKVELFPELINFIRVSSTNELAISKKDLFILGAIPIPGNEHLYASIESELTYYDPKIIKINAEEYKEFHPTGFDFKNYLQIFRPKYVIPIKGLYKDMIKFRDYFSRLNLPNDNYLIVFNGEKAGFVNGNYIGTEKSGKEFGKIIIENNINKSISPSVISEREVLGKNGIVNIGLVIDTKTKEIVTKPDIQMRGVVFIKNQSELVEDVSNLFLEKVNFYMEETEKVDKNKIIQKSVKEITKLLKQKIQKTPTILIKLFDTNPDIKYNKTKK